MGIATRPRPRGILARAEPTRPPAPAPFVRRAARKRSRRNLLLGLFAFVAIQLFLFGLLQWREHWRDPQFGDKKRRLERLLTQQGDRPFLLLAMGSSRTGMGFNGAIVSEGLSEPLGKPVLAFNLGIPAVGPVLQLTYLKRILADGIRPDLLLVEVHPAMLTNELGQPIEKRGLFVEQLRYSEIPAIQGYRYLEGDAQFQWWQSNLCPTSGARFAILGRLLPNWLPSAIRFDWGRRTDPWGWNASYWVDPPPQLRESALRVAKNEYELMLQELRFETAPVEALKQLLATAAEHDVPVVLVLMPEGPTFRSWYPDEVTRRLEAFIASLNTPYINARDWVAEEDFLDSHHLLQSGAKHFSARLSQELNRFLSARE